MTNEGFESLRPQWPFPSSVQSLLTTRLGGVSLPPYSSLNLGNHVGDIPSHVEQNRAILKKNVPCEPIWLSQVHGAIVSRPGARYSEADGIVSNTPNEVLAILTADCLPVLFTNTSGTIIGAAHAGWRGLCAGVLENTVSEMRALAKTNFERDIIAWLGPAIGPKAFEVGQDVVDAFVDFGTPFPDDAFVPIEGLSGKYLANIYLLARSRLTAQGITNIYGGDFCTVTQGDRFFSYRRDGVTGRFASLIWIA